MVRYLTQAPIGKVGGRMKSTKPAPSITSGGRSTCSSANDEGAITASEKAATTIRAARHMQTRHMQKGSRVPLIGGGAGGSAAERGIMTEAGVAAKGLGAGVRPRPRERLRDLGPGALGDAELLALVVGSGTPGRSAMVVGRLLARRRPEELAEWPASRWMRIPGIGAARAA